MNKLYDLVLNNQQLNLDSLTECGLSLDSITEMVKNNILKKKNDVYEFIDTDKLFSYGIELVHNRQIDRASACFFKCLEINPTHIGAASQLFLTNIYNENFEQAFKYFEIIYKGNNIQDNNLYLYLFSFVIKLPDEYKKIVDDMLYEDTLLETNNPQVNEIRKLIFKNKFIYALSNLNNLMHSNAYKKQFVRDIVTKKLLTRVINIGRLTNEKIYDLLQNKDYKGIINLLNSRTNLTLIEQYILKLSCKYIDISETKVIPECVDIHTTDIFTAIDRNNFKSALYLSKIPGNNLTLKITNIILNDLVSKITEIKKEQIIYYLKKQDLDLSLEKLKDYLDYTDRKKCEKYVINTIKLCLKENDNSFSKVGEVLDEISKNELANINFYDNDLSNDTYYNFLYEQYKKLPQKKVIIVDNEEMAKNIGRYIRFFSNIQVFKIRRNDKINMVLKHRKRGNEDLKELMEEGKRYFDEGNYQKTIECYELLNSLSGKNTAFCYSILGWSYFRLNDYKNALKYLIITDYLNKVEKKEFDLEQTITNLENIISRNNVSKKNNNESNLDKIKSLQEIASLINTGSMSIYEASVRFGLDKKEVNIIKLIIAKDSYSKKDYVKGDNLLKQVELSECSDEFVLNLLEEVRKNKMLYSEEKGKQFSITMGVKEC